MNTPQPSNGLNLNFFNRGIQHRPVAQIVQGGLGYSFEIGKDLQALSMHGRGATFQITQSRRNEECYNNIGRHAVMSFIRC